MYAMAACISPLLLLFLLGLIHFVLFQAMTRGRKKDLSIPPSRSLTQQRNYRARKAQHIADLEQRCRLLEAENASLKQELRKLQTASSFTSSGAAVDPELVSRILQMRLRFKAQMGA